MSLIPTILETFSKGGDNYAKHVLNTPGQNGDKITVTQNLKTGELFICVADGAVSPYFITFDGEATDAWASRMMHFFMIRHVHQGKKLALAQDIIRGAIPAYAKMCDVFRAECETEFHFDGTLKPNEKLSAKVWNPACAFVAASFHMNGSISIAQGTDCTVSAIYADGSIRVLTPDKHVELLHQGKLNSTSAKGLPQDRIANGENPETILAEEFEINYYNRETAYNKPDGIAVFNGEMELISDFCIQNLFISPEAAQKIDKLVFISDGMVPGQLKTEDAVRHIATHGAEDYYNNVLIPHFKGANPVPTDTSAVVVQL